jgi:hypothetical protein
MSDNVEDDDGGDDGDGDGDSDGYDMRNHVPGMMTLRMRM